MIRKILHWVLGYWYDNEERGFPPIWLSNLYLRQVYTKEQLASFKKQALLTIDKLVSDLKDAEDSP